MNGRDFGRGRCGGGGFGRDVGRRLLERYGLFPAGMLDIAAHSLLPITDKRVKS